MGPYAHQTTRSQKGIDEPSSSWMSQRERYRSFRVVHPSWAQARAEACARIDALFLILEDPTITHDTPDLMGAAFNSAWVIVKPPQLEPHSPKKNSCGST